MGNQLLGIINVGKNPLGKYLDITKIKDKNGMDKYLKGKTEKEIKEIKRLFDENKFNESMTKVFNNAYSDLYGLKTTIQSEPTPSLPINQYGGAIGQPAIAVSANPTIPDIVEKIGKTASKPSSETTPTTPEIDPYQKYLDEYNKRTGRLPDAYVQAYSKAKEGETKQYDFKYKKGDLLGAFLSGFGGSAARQINKAITGAQGEKDFRKNYIEPLEQIYGQDLTDKTARDKWNSKDYVGAIISSLSGSESKLTKGDTPIDQLDKTGMKEKIDMMKLQAQQELNLALIKKEQEIKELEMKLISAEKDSALDRQFKLELEKLRSEKKAITEEASLIESLVGTTSTKK